MKKAKPDEESSLGAPATIMVSLPVDAKLTVDGNATGSTSGVRTLVTPALDSAKSYSYTLQAETVRDGRTYRLEKQINVVGGQTTRVSFADLVAAENDTSKAVASAAR